ncbi:nitrite reductase (NADH) large subunit [Povalibacter uvarum]|uniref:Nitrite reductase (NADH) large subunit n=1 Tax=Povalibacter uvarum TaxID=732238 RepID=A0A841HIB1_9GAMM|nr:nitrite reductase (NADH) large subunit [Povalibacter uvarum]
MKTSSNWTFVCELDDILSGTGVAALIDGRQLAIFRVGDSVYALDNYDPNSEANVLSRGLVGDIQGDLVVASPIYKHHFSLISGRCLEDPDQSVHAYPARVTDGRVWVRSVPLRPVARTRHLVVIGNGMAGMRVVEDLLQIAPNAYRVTVFGAEPHPNYNRILLSPVLAGEKRVEDIILHSLDWYREKGVTLHTSDPIVSIDRVRRTVRSQSGIEVPYDRLLIASGSNPVMLPIPGNDLPGVVTFRDLQDVDAMLAATRTHKKAVVIGGGLLGLEAANGLLKQGMDVTVVHIFDTLMERQLDRAAADLLRESLEKRGLKFRMQAKTVEILSTGHEWRGTSQTDSEAHAASLAPRARVAGVCFEDGSELEADLVVMAVGIRPNIDLAKAAGLRCERGVLVNDTMQTFDPSIYAVGECVQHRNSTYGLVAPLFDQARVCATHLAEFGIGHYMGSMVSTQLKVTGIDVFSAGDFIGGPTSEALVMRDARRGIYKRIVIENNKVRGAVLYGDVKDGAWYMELMTQGRDIGPLRDKLLFGSAFAGKA